MGGRRSLRPDRPDQGTGRYDPAGPDEQCRQQRPPFRLANTDELARDRDLQPAEDQESGSRFGGHRMSDLSGTPLKRPSTITAEHAMIVNVPA
ncbi:hypothetical protein GCM10023196_092650 [Actinoallomurus vinaceus]|uniref:Uncharacterized protein n=1 Tax=Actinoallomurus vinaceus TaxID=1080074 RepID=A0ABP8URI1_9ACTN